MQNYKEINGNDYVKDSRKTINETMQSIQSMNSGTAFPTTNLFEGMKCYRTDLKKTYTLTDVENNTWVKDAHAELADESTKLTTARNIGLSGAVTADAASFDGTADATINVKTLDASKLKGTAAVSTTGNADTASKLAGARTISLGGNATGSANFDGSCDVTINATVNQAAHANNADVATKVNTAAANNTSDVELVRATVGGSDFFRIIAGGRGSNNGYAAIDTADDGNEPIYVRQYTGTFTNNVRTATLLDANGNTSFPGNVKAGSFTGPLNGNATTATTAATANKGTWKGKNDNRWYQMAFSLDSEFDWQSAGAFQYNPASNVLKVGTVQGNVNGNSATATKLANESGSNYLEINTTTDNWNVLGSNPGSWLKSIRTNGSAPPYSIGNYSAAIAFGGSDTKGIITHAYGDPLVKFAGGNGSTAQWKFSIQGGRNNEVYNLNDFPTKTGGGASGTWGINVTGNAGSANVGKALQVFDGSNNAINSTFHWVGQSGQPFWIWGSNDGTNQYVYDPANFKVSYATNANGAVNADKLDGLHASDLYRYIGGHGSPVLTDIFDRAGTIDLTGLSAADKARHKTYINKQNNVAQNLWNNTTGIHAYGGDVDMANGYAHGTLKLTQNYMNFDKILVVACNDDAIWVEYRIWDTWELAHAFSSCFSFDFIGAYGLYWIVYGTQQHGTGKFAWSTDTVLSCREQNSGIIAIYGIKY